MKKKSEVSNCRVFLTSNPETKLKRDTEEVSFSVNGIAYDPKSEKLE